MAISETLSRDNARRWLASGPIVTIATIGCGIVLGQIIMDVGDRPTRWLVYLLGGLTLLMVAAAGGMRRRNLMAFMVVALSLNVHYYITRPEPLQHMGISGPQWFSIPLILFPTGALALSYLLAAWSGQLRIRWGFPIAKFALMVFATATLSTLLSATRRYGIYSLVEMSQFFLIFLVAVNVVREEADLKLVIRALLVTLALQTSLFMIQTVTGASFSLTGQVMHATSGPLRASGTVGTTPSGYAIFVEPLLFTALALWRVRDAGVSRRWTGGLVLLGSFTLMLTLNRTSWGTLILGTVAVELLVRLRGVARPLSPRTKATLIGVGVLGVLAVIPLILPRLNEPHSSDWDSRRALMLLALDMIRGNFVVGVGPGSYPFHIMQYAPRRVAGDWLWVVHNEFLLVWAERGILGFTAWLLFMRSGVMQAWAASRRTDFPQLQAFGVGCCAAFLGLAWEYSLNMWPPFSCYALHWFLFGVLLASSQVRAATENGAPAVDAPAR